MPELCGDCGIELSPSLLVCPRCHALVHKRRLAELARDAEASAAAGEHEQAVTLWRSALALLPRASKQYAAVAEKIESGVRAQQQSKPKPKTVSGKVVGGITAVVIAIATKAKLLLLGLTKLGTVSSILISFGLYWKLWGWQFAAALLGAIYIHEIGHVAALQKRGLAASAPMFVPGFGAFVRMHEHAATPTEDARVGLAGPLWGLGAATIAIAYGVTHEGLLILVGLAAAWRAFEKEVERDHDWIAFAQFVLLIGLGAALSVVPVPTSR